MGSLSSFNRGVKYLLSVINVFTKNALKLLGKKDETVLYGFIELVNQSKRKPNKLLVDQRR